MTHVKFNRKPFEGTFNSIVDDLFAELPVFIKMKQTPWKGFVPVNIKEKIKTTALKWWPWF